MRAVQPRMPNRSVLGLLIMLVVTVTACSSAQEVTTTVTATPASTAASSTTAAAPATTTSFPIDETAEPFPAEDLVGDWYTKAKYLQTFSEDGTWMVFRPNGKLADSGSWEMKTATLVMVSEMEDSPTPCRAGDTGYFELTATDEGLDLDGLRDDCRGRWGELQRGLTPAD